MRTWLFQGNPDDFDLDAYLASRPAQIVWLVTRYETEISVGDRVYIWRTQGKSKQVSGVIAEGIVTAPPAVRGEDPSALHLWKSDDPRGSEPRLRVVLRLVKVAGARQIIQRAWCVDDPVLRDLPNIKMAAATNYPLTAELARRMDAIWARTGRDWNRRESLAGLTAYAETYGQSVSRLPGSPVARVALLIGRAVTGVYAKVMNFRALDPRVTGEGMRGAGDTDRAVWEEFYDAETSMLREDALSREFLRLWGEAHAQQVINLPEAAGTMTNIDEEASRLEKLTLNQLLTRYAAQIKTPRPATRLQGIRVYDRNPLVIAIARLRAAHECEVAGCSHPTFLTVDGSPYVEVHHIVPLVDGGEDILENVACLCPAHHREVHLGKRAGELTEHLKGMRQPIQG